jgi:hypothetical protein
LEEEKREQEPMSERVEEEFMEAAAEIAMEWFDITPIARALREAFERGEKIGFERGKDAYRDALLKQIDARYSRNPNDMSIEKPVDKPLAAVGDGKGAEQVAERPAEPTTSPRIRTDRPAGARSPGAPRPKDIPSTFTMIQTVLGEPTVSQGRGLTLQELADAIEARWWPGMHKNSIAADISTWTTKGRFSRDADGKLLLTEQGRKVISTDNRLKSVGPASEEPQAPVQASAEPTAEEMPAAPEPSPQAAPKPAMTPAEITDRATALAARNRAVLPREPVKLPVPAVRPTEGRRPVTPGARLGPPPQGSGRPFLYKDKSVDLAQHEWRMAEALKRAMGRGHLDYTHLGLQGRGAVSRAAVSDKTWLSETIPVLSRKVGEIGLEVVHAENYGYVMREVQA